jgi:hypothetical protein
VGFGCRGRDAVRGLYFQVALIDKKMPYFLQDSRPLPENFLAPCQGKIFRHRSIPESSERILHSLLMTQISKDDYTDFLDFSIKFVSV